MSEYLTTGTIVEVVPMQHQPKKIFYEGGQNMSNELLSLTREISDKVNNIKTRLLLLEEDVTKLKNSPDPSSRIPMPSGRGYKFGEFVQAVIKSHFSKGADYESIKKAMTVGSDSSGGFLVPEELQREVLRISESASICERRCRHIRMTSSTLKIPTLETSVSVSWKNEGQAAGDTTPVLDEIELEPKKLTSIVTVSNELLQDAGLDVINFLQILFGECIGKELDSQVLCGVGSPTSGILLTAGHSVVMANGHTSFSAVSPAYLSRMIAQIPSTVLDNCVFIMHPTVLDYLRAKTDNNGRYIFEPSGSGELRIWGYPVLTSDVMPSTSAPSTPFLIFGNLEYFLIADRMEMSIAVDPYTQFAEYQSRVRVVRRLDLKMARSQAFCRLITAST